MNIEKLEPWRHYAFSISAVFIGGAIGLLTALSSSPVVATIIPLLFGLLAGGSGLLLAREDLSQKNGRERLFFIGVTVTSLCVGLFASIIVTIYFLDEEYTVSINEIPNISDMSETDILYILEYRIIAKLLGAKPRELEYAQNLAASSRLKEDSNNIIKVDSRLAGAIRASALVDFDLDQIVSDSARNSIALISATSKSFQSMIEEERDNHYTAYFDRHISIIRSSLDEIFGSDDYFDPSEFDGLFNQPQLLETIFVLDSAIDDYLGNSESGSDNLLSEDRKALLQFGANARSETQNTRPSRPIAGIIEDWGSES